eukprot:scaffold111994_cov39-Tisochrysis_lutea.AAC.2
MDASAWRDCAGTQRMSRMMPFEMARIQCHVSASRRAQREWSSPITPARISDGMRAGSSAATARMGRP